MKSRIVIFALLGLLACATYQVSFAQGSSGFPIVNPLIQQDRDIDRRYILQTELQEELKKLAIAQAQPSAPMTNESAMNVHRHQENINALQRELARIDKAAVVRPQPPHALHKVRRAIVQPPRDQKGARAYWNPYNRAPDAETTASFPTTPRRVHHEYDH